MGVDPTSAGVYEFGPFRVDARERLLRKGDAIVPLTPKAVDTLVALVDARGQLVGKDVLMDRLWPGTFVEEANLSNQISLLRKALGDSAGDPRYIETVPKRGYRFVATVVEAAPRESSAARSGHVPNKRSWMAGVVAAGAVLVFIATSGTWLLTRDAGQPSVPPSITRLTTTGQVRHAAISPDGRYVAYVALSDEGQSLWTQDLTSTSKTEVVPTAPLNYLGMTFSPDSTSLYYVVREPDRPREGALYRAPVLGGTAPPVRVLVEIDTPIAFSPDGRRISYIVANQLTGRSALMVADAAGRTPYALATRTMPEEFAWHLAGPLWAPDGASIITAGMSIESGRQSSNLVEVQTSDGSQRQLGNRRFTQVGRLGWLKGATALVVAASDRLDANQLWEVSYPGGTVRPITDDGSKDYAGLSMTTDATLIATVQRDRQSHLWMSENGAADRSRRMTDGKYDGRFGLAWTPDGRIVYHSLEGGNEDIWLMNGDGSGRRQLTADSAVDEDLFVSANGRHVVFSSDQSGTFNVWRVDMNGGAATRLTSGHRDQNPVVTPDGNWVIYESSTSGTPTLWKVAIGGGRPLQLTRFTSTNPALSPDGTLIACRYRSDPNTEGTIAVVRLSDGALVRQFTPPPGSTGLDLQWTADGITYVVAASGGANIWSQPLDGGSPRQLTHFASGGIAQDQTGPQPGEGCCMPGGA